MDIFKHINFSHHMVVHPDIIVGPFIKYANICGYCQAGQTLAYRLYGRFLSVEEYLNKIVRL